MSVATCPIPSEQLIAAVAATPFSGRVDQVELPVGGTLEDLVARAIDDPILRNYAVVEISGEMISPEHWARVRPKAGAVLTVYIRPGSNSDSGEDGDTKALRTVLQILVIFAAAWVTGGAGGALQAGGFWASVGGAAVSILGNYAINQLVPLEPASSGNQQRDAFNALNGARNTARPYEPVSMILGEHRVAFDLYAQIIQETVNTQLIASETVKLAPAGSKHIYMRLAYCLGPAPVDLSGLQIGETPIEEFDDIEVETRLTADAPAHTLYTDDPFQEALGVVLSDDWTVRRTLDDVDEIEIIIGCRTGLGKINNKGRTEAITAHLDIEYRPVGATQWSRYPTDSDQARDAVIAAGGTDRQTFLQSRSFDDWVAAVAALGVWSTHGTYMRLFAGTLTGFRKAWRIAVPRGDYDVRIRRREAESTESTVNDRVHWEVLGSVKAVDPFPDKNLASLVIRLKASAQLNGVVETLNGVLRTLAPTFSTTALSDPDSAQASDLSGSNVTRNPAELALWAVRGPQALRPKADDEIDWRAWAAFAKHCNDHTLHFDENVTNPISRGDLLNRICAAGYGRPLKQNGKLSVVIDRLRDGEPPAQMFTPRNVNGFRLRKIWPQEIHGVRARFFNRDNDYRADEVTIYADGFDETNATIIATQDIPGKTDPDELRRVLRRYFNNAQRQLETYSFQQDAESLVAARGAYVIVQHDVLSVGLGSAKVESVEVVAGQATGFVLDAPINTEAGVTLAARWRSVIGDADAQLQAEDEIIVLRDPDAPGRFTFSTSLAEVEAPSVGDLLLIGETARVAVEALIRDIEPEFDNQAQLTLVSYAPERFIEDGPLAPHDPKISLPLDLTPPAPVLISVNTSDRGVFIGFVQSRPPRGGVLAGFEIWSRVKTGAEDGWVSQPSLLENERAVQLPPGEPGVDYQAMIVTLGRDAGGMLLRSDPLLVDYQGSAAAPAPVSPVALFVERVSPSGVRQIVLEARWTPSSNPEITITEIQAHIGGRWRTLASAAASVGEAEVHGLPVGRDYTLGFINRTRRGAVSDRVVLAPIAAPEVLVSSEARGAAAGSALDQALQELVSSADDARTGIDALQDTYGDTAAAAQSAEAAAAANSAAQAAKGLVETARDAALNARDLAEQHMQGSQASKQLAETAKLAAESARDAAQTKASNAENSAQASLGSANLAVTKSDEAQDSAATAAASVVSAQSARDEAFEAVRDDVLPSRCDSLKYFSGGAVGAPSSKADFGTIEGVSILGNCIRFPTPTNNVMAPRGVVNHDPNAIYEIWFRYIVLDEGTVGNGVFVRFGFFSTDQSFVAVDDNIQPEEHMGVLVLDGVQEATLLVGGSNTLVSDSHARLSADAVYWRPHIRQNWGDLSDGIIGVFDIRIRDVTARVSAEKQASAAAESAMQAAASAGASGQSAGASESAKVAAETAKADALAEKQAAVSAKSAAESAASTATQQANLATAAKEDADSAASSALTHKNAASSFADAAQAASSAAETAKIAAQTAQSGAETASGQAATSATNADNSRAQAASHESNAAQSASSAGGSASAAASDASIATTKAGEAITAANAAESSKVQAQAAKDSATTSASAALTSAASASDKAAAAQTSQEIAANWARSVSRGSSVANAQISPRWNPFAQYLTFGAIMDDTIIYLDGVEILTLDAWGTATTFCNPGVVTSNRPLAVKGQRHELPADCQAGTKFTAYMNRFANPVIFHFRSPHGPSKVKIWAWNITTGSGQRNVNTDNPTATIDVSDVASWQLNDGAGTDDIEFRFLSDKPVVIVQQGATGDHEHILPAFTTGVLSRGANSYLLTFDVADANAVTVYKDGAALGVGQCDGSFQGFSIGDGKGADCNVGIDVDMLGNAYILGHELKDYEIVAIHEEPIYIVGSTGVLATHTPHSGASIFEPDVITVGNQMGNDGLDPVIQPSGQAVLIRSDRPFALRSNHGEFETRNIGFRFEDVNLETLDLGARIKTNAEAIATEKTARVALDTNLTAAVEDAQSGAAQNAQAIASAENSIALVESTANARIDGVEATAQAVQSALSSPDGQIAIAGFEVAANGVTAEIKAIAIDGPQGPFAGVKVTNLITDRVNLESGGISDVSFAYIEDVSIDRAGGWTDVVTIDITNDSDAVVEIDAKLYMRAAGYVPVVPGRTTTPSDIDWRFLEGSTVVLKNDNSAGIDPFSSVGGIGDYDVLDIKGRYRPTAGQNTLKLQIREPAAHCDFDVKDSWVKLTEYVTGPSGLNVFADPPPPPGVSFPH